jgi:hypothetical protein
MRDMHNHDDDAPGRLAVHFMSAWSHDELARSCSALLPRLHSSTSTDASLASPPATPQKKRSFCIRCKNKDGCSCVPHALPTVHISEPSPPPPEEAKQPEPADAFEHLTDDSLILTSEIMVHLRRFFDGVNAESMVSGGALTGACARTREERPPSHDCHRYIMAALQLTLLHSAASLLSLSYVSRIDSTVHQTMVRLARTTSGAAMRRVRHSQSSRYARTRTPYRPVVCAMLPQAVGSLYLIAAR